MTRLDRLIDLGHPDGLSRFSSLVFSILLCMLGGCARMQSNDEQRQMSLGYTKPPSRSTCAWPKFTSAWEYLFCEWWLDGSHRRDLCQPMEIDFVWMAHYENKQHWHRRNFKIARRHRPSPDHWTQYGLQAWSHGRLTEQFIVSQMSISCNGC